MNRFNLFFLHTYYTLNKNYFGQHKRNTKIFGMNIYLLAFPYCHFTKTHRAQGIKILGYLKLGDCVIADIHTQYYNFLKIKSKNIYSYVSYVLYSIIRLQVNRGIFRGFFLNIQDFKKLKSLFFIGHKEIESSLSLINQKLKYYQLIYDQYYYFFVFLYMIL